VRPSGYLLIAAALAAGCAFETQSVGNGNGGLNGNGVEPGTNEGGTGGTGGTNVILPDDNLNLDNPHGIIVENPTCTPGTERSTCAGTSCDPLTLSCSQIPLMGRGTCETCVSDSNCADPSHRCVWMTYEGRPFPDEDTGFCLQVTDERGTGCPPPFVVPLVERESLSGGKNQSYCGIYEKMTTCPAIRAFHNQQSCPGGRDDECSDGGLCRGVTVGKRTEYFCTYACMEPSECSTSVSKINCAGYCGG
jgi:hypothetical protein